MNKNKLNIVKSAIKNDKKAIVELIKMVQNDIYTTLYYLKQDENDIYDIMQIILIKLSKKITQLKNASNFNSWLNHIVLNTYYDYLRKNSKNQNTAPLNLANTLEIPDYSENPQERILNLELDYIIKNSINSLPIHYRIPITLREIQGLSYEEISDITSSSIGTVKSRIARARNLIQKDINNYSRS